MITLDEFFAQYKDDHEVWWSLSEGQGSDAFDVVFLRAEAAETTLASCNRARQSAEAECERLRAELSVARDLLSGVPEHSAGWYADICDYLETLDNTR